MKKIIDLRTDYEISDDDFNDVSKPFDDALDSWFENHRDLIDEFVAFYVAKGIEYDALWSGSFRGLVNSAIDTLSGFFVGEKINVERFNKLLLDKYGLKLIQENPMRFEKIK